MRREATSSPSSKWTILRHSQSERTSSSPSLAASAALSTQPRQRSRAVLPATRRAGADTTAVQLEVTNSFRVWERASQRTQYAREQLEELHEAMATLAEKRAAKAPE